MMDRLIAIKDKFLAFWDKYTTKQKTLIISVVLCNCIARLFFDKTGLYRTC